MTAHRRLPGWILCGLAAGLIFGAMAPFFGLSAWTARWIAPWGAIFLNLLKLIAVPLVVTSLGMDLTWTAQLTLILTAVLASIGTAAVPSAAIIMLVILLEAVGIPSAGIAMILGVDRLLDMLRTVTNVTGDAAVAVVVAASEGRSAGGDPSSG